MLYSISPHPTFGHFLNIFGHRGLKKKIQRHVLLKNVSTHRTVSASSSTSSANKARGGLPRFYSEQLPASKDKIVRVEGDESWHMTKVLRLGVTDRVELFNGWGEIVEGQILKVDRSGVDIVAAEDPVMLTPSGPQWHVVAAFGTLKGGRADWLVEKSTELGASSITPLLTERSTSISENRVDRWQRVMLAALKQCQRLHQMVVKPPVGIDCILPQITASSLSFLAMAEATPLVDALSVVDKNAGGLLLVGPEGDFTDKEVKALTKAGAIPVGLGPCRLRVETATITLLAAAMLWTDVHHVES
ncbi:uncharacterized protein LOC131063259 [Cryptomeria japonica]|uniref:uncharacterized protein LOC131063259 n=1 Tax=Cryptomeria japonica TaxID=3369 RepID=UPI0027DA0A93|nr:uncharacterized protein LOC131063259 [Cryptomeria japonica]